MREGADPLLVRLLAVIAVVVVTLALAVPVMGPRVTPWVLVAAVGTVVTLAYRDWVASDCGGCAQGQVPAVAPTQEIWHSDRWVQETAAQGLRSLDTWLWEQRSS